MANRMIAMCVIALLLVLCPFTIRNMLFRHNIKTNSQINFSSMDEKNHFSEIPGDRHKNSNIYEKMQATKFNVKKASQITLTRPDACHGCFDINIEYLIKNDICSSTEPIEFVVIILTALDHVKNRRAIRDTWAKEIRQKKINIHYAFMVGVSEKENRMVNVAKENNRYHDIIQGNFLDTYKNLTVKTIFGLNWVTTECDFANYVIKIDDDVWLNPRYLLSTLQQRQVDFTNNVVGYCHEHPKPVIRDILEKWHLSYEMYPHEYFPPYCSGSSYAMTLRSAERIVSVSRDIPYLEIEDVYIGICMKKLGLTVKSVEGFGVDLPKDQICVNDNEVLTSYDEKSPSDFYEIWKATCGQKNYTN